MTTARTALGLTLYLDEPLRWSHSHAGDLFGSFLALVGPERLRFWTNEAMSTWKRVDRDFLAHASSSISTGGMSRYIRHQYGIQIANDPGAPSLAFRYKELDPARGPRASYLQIVLPLDHDPNDLVQLALEVANAYPVRFAAGGFVGTWNPQARTTAWTRLYGWSRRYLGLDLAYPERWSWHLAKGLPCPSWITLLGRRHMDALGIDGAALLGRAWRQDVTAFPLPEAIVLRAGEQPSLGDRNCIHYPAAIAEVACALDPWMLVEPPPFPGRFTEEEATDAWLHRFAFPERWV